MEELKGGEKIVYEKALNMKREKELLIGGVKFTFICLDFMGLQWLDTKVFIEGVYLFTIAGNAVDAFMTDLKKLEGTYRI